jgi:hypothetical protein
VVVAQKVLAVLMMLPMMLIGRDSMILSRLAPKREAR